MLLTRKEYGELPWRDLDSSNICRVARWGQGSFVALIVEFHTGRTYYYANVPESVVEDLLEADSAGSFFAQHVKGEYDWGPVEQAGE